MRSNDQTELIQRIHASGKQIVLAVTGGGSGAIAALLEVPGASASLLEAVVPYSEAALVDWLGGIPDNFCSERTARAMAMAAFERARTLSTNDPDSLIGIGATASLVSNHPKRGPHRIHVAWQTAETTAAISIELSKGERIRTEEETVAAVLVLNAIAEATRSNAAPLCATMIHEQVMRREKRAPIEWTELLLGMRSVIEISADRGAADGKYRSSDSFSIQRVVFPGAFDPLHGGHEQMGQIAGVTCGMPVWFELSVTNVDKPPLDFLELENRLNHLSGRPVLVTRAPTFVEKARLLPNSTFVVGIDTIARIADPRYYGGETARRDAAISSIVAAGCRFLVFGRLAGDIFQTTADLELPTSLLKICDQVPESTFRIDMSSTALRNAKAASTSEKT